MTILTLSDYLLLLIFLLIQLGCRLVLKALVSMVTFRVQALSNASSLWSRTNCHKTFLGVFFPSLDFESPLDSEICALLLSSLLQPPEFHYCYYLMFVSLVIGGERIL